MIEYFELKGVAKPVNNLIIAYFVLTILMIIDEYFGLSNNSFDGSFGLVIFLIMYLLGLIYLFISYIILGIGFIKNQAGRMQKELLYLGYAYAVITPIGMLASIFLLLNNNTKELAHLMVIAELIPLLIVISIYKKLVQTDE